MPILKAEGILSLSLLLLLTRIHLYICPLVASMGLCVGIGGDNDDDSILLFYLNGMLFDDLLCQSVCGIKRLHTSRK